MSTKRNTRRAQRRLPTLAPGGRPRPARQHSENKGRLVFRMHPQSLFSIYSTLSRLFEESFLREDLRRDSNPPLLAFLDNCLDEIRLAFLHPSSFFVFPDQEGLEFGVSDWFAGTYSGESGGSG